MSAQVSIELIWEIAAQEALSGKFGEILPDHFFMAILKFSELSQDRIGKIIEDVDVAAFISSDIEGVAKILKTHGINSTKLRRHLRQIVGTGNKEPDGKGLHRSEESRLHFARATEIASSMGLDMMALTLLDEFMQYPTQAMIEVLGELIIKNPSPSNTPLLDKWAVSIPERIYAQKLEGVGSLQYAAVALQIVLEAEKPHSVFLICEELKPLEQTIVNLVKKLSATEGSPSPIKQIMEIRPELFSAQTPKDSLGILLSILQEATNISGLVLVGDFASSGKLDIVSLGIVIDFIASNALRVIMPINRDVYNALVAENFSLIRKIHSMWIAPVVALPSSYDYADLGVFTDNATYLIRQVNCVAHAEQNKAITLATFINGLGSSSEARLLLSSCLAIPRGKLKLLRNKPISEGVSATLLPFSAEMIDILQYARKISLLVPDLCHPGFIDLQRLVCAIGLSKAACEILETEPYDVSDAINVLKTWYENQPKQGDMGDLTGSLKKIRDKMLANIFGQDHAVHAFIEGVFNAEIVANSDTGRKAPKAIFVFAGPPGVGKTYMAEMVASSLNRPYLRFDMSSFSSSQTDGLIGIHKSYQSAHPGQLTEFVEKNPEAILLFDEIEKAHANTIYLFLQMLDAGILQDKFHEKNVNFRDTIIIFTTNAGRNLYDRPNSSGVHAANAAFHRKTILDALENEKNPATGQPFFPQAICSRMATGYPIMFNHLGVSELSQVVSKELKRVAQLFEMQYYKSFTFSDMLPLCLVLKEGAQVDARTLRAQAETYLKTEIFKFSQLFDAMRLDEVFSQIDEVHFAYPENEADIDADIRSAFALSRPPQVIILANPALANLYKEKIPAISWFTAASANEALEIAANTEIDLILLDIWLGGDPLANSMLSVRFDHVPMGSKGLEKGQEALYKLRERLPNTAIYLLSLLDNSEGNSTPSIDDELFMACVRGGGARGIISSSVTDTEDTLLPQHASEVSEELLAITKRLHLEKTAKTLGQERKTLLFDSVPKINRKQRTITITMSKLRFKRAIASDDAGEVLDDVERPRTRFEDVIGADNAKEELKFFIDYLKNPRRFIALGLKPPKGILLYGPPGTGKTMLARAMAGESNVAFISVSSTNFVTQWQGSGPQNIRDLFARARRYAPSIIFIDEIDAIGKSRTGSSNSKAEENTLNALLTELDGFTGPSPDKPVFVLAATNYEVEPSGDGSSAKSLDAALVRRFARSILVDLPERNARKKYLLLRLENRASCTVTEETIDLIAERSSGMSIANLESIIETAARKALKLEVEMSGKILEEAFETVRYGEKRTKSQADMLRTARHEAGHTLLYWLSGWWPSYVTIVARGDHGGYMAPAAEEIEKRSVRSRNTLLADLRVALAGRAAELVCYGDISGLTTGASSDLEYATRIARSMLCRYGMYPEFGLLAMPELMQSESAISSPDYHRMNQMATQILNEEMQNTILALKDNHHHLDAVVAYLIKQERVTKEELQMILPALTII